MTSQAQLKQPTLGILCQNRNPETNATSTNSILGTLDPLVLFPQVEKMLCDLAWKASKKTGIPFEDCRSHAYWTFMKACGQTEWKGYNEHKGTKFSTYLYFVVSLAMRRFESDWHKHVNRTLLGSRNDYRTAKMEKVDLDGRNKPIDCDIGIAPPTENTAYSIWEDFSQDAQEILHLLIECPAELFGPKIKSTKKLVRRVRKLTIHRGGKLRNHKLKVAKSRWDLAFHEIQQKLRAAWSSSSAPSWR